MKKQLKTNRVYNHTVGKLSLAQFATEYIQHEVLREKPSLRNRLQRQPAYKALANKLKLTLQQVLTMEKSLRRYMFLRAHAMRTTTNPKREAWYCDVLRALTHAEDMQLESISPWAGRAGGAVTALTAAARRRGSLCSRHTYEEARAAAGCVVTAINDLHHVWVRTQRVCMRSVWGAARRGDVPPVPPAPPAPSAPPGAPRPLPHPAPPAARVADLVLLHTDVTSQRLLTPDSAASYSESPALLLVWQLVQLHAVHAAHVRDVVHAWTKVWRDYKRSGRVASIVVLQRRWHELKLQARRVALSHWTPPYTHTNRYTQTHITYNTHRTRHNPDTTHCTIENITLTRKPRPNVYHVATQTKIVLNNADMILDEDVIMTHSVSNEGTVLIRPAPIHLDILRKFPCVATKPCVSWEQLCTDDLIVRDPMPDAETDDSDIDNELDDTQRQIVQRWNNDLFAQIQLEDEISEDPKQDKTSNVTTVQSSTETDDSDIEPALEIVEQDLPVIDVDVTNIQTHENNDMRNEQTFNSTNNKIKNEKEQINVNPKNIKKAHPEVLKLLEKDKNEIDNISSITQTNISDNNINLSNIVPELIENVENNTSEKDIEIIENFINNVQAGTVTIHAKPIEIKSILSCEIVNIKKEDASDILSTLNVLDPSKVEKCIKFESDSEEELPYLQDNKVEISKIKQKYKISNKLIFDDDVIDRVRDRLKFVDDDVQANVADRKDKIQKIDHKLLQVTKVIVERIEPATFWELYNISGPITTSDIQHLLLKHNTAYTNDIDDLEDNENIDEIDNDEEIKEPVSPNSNKSVGETTNKVDNLPEIIKLNMDINNVQNDNNSCTQECEKMEEDEIIENLEQTDEQDISERIIRNTKLLLDRTAILISSDEDEDYSFKQEKKIRVAKKVELPDIEEVRRVNRNILTAQVAPITAQVAPITAHVAPITAQIAPITAQVAPITAQVAPITAQAATISAQAVTNSAQVVTSNAQIESNIAQVMSNTAEITSASAQVGINSVQVGIDSAQVLDINKISNSNAQAMNFSAQNTSNVEQVSPCSTQVGIDSEEVTITGAQVANINSKDVNNIAQVPNTNEISNTNAQIMNNSALDISYTAQVLPNSAQVLPNIAEVTNTSEISNNNEQVINSTEQVILNTAQVTPSIVQVSSNITQETEDNEQIMNNTEVTNNSTEDTSKCGQVTSKNTQDKINSELDTNNGQDTENSPQIENNSLNIASITNNSAQVLLNTAQVTNNSAQDVENGGEKENNNLEKESISSCAQVDQNTTQNVCDDVTMSDVSCRPQEGLSDPHDQLQLPTEQDVKLLVVKLTSQMFVNICCEVRGARYSEDMKLLGGDAPHITHTHSASSCTCCCVWLCDDVTSPDVTHELRALRDHILKVFKFHKKPDTETKSNKNSSSKKPKPVPSRSPSLSSLTEHSDIDSCHRTQERDKIKRRSTDSVKKTSSKHEMKNNKQSAKNTPKNSKDVLKRRNTDKSNDSSKNTNKKPKTNNKNKETKEKEAEVNKNSESRNKRSKKSRTSPEALKAFQLFQSRKALDAQSEGYSEWMRQKNINSFYFKPKTNKPPEKVPKKALPKVDVPPKAKISFVLNNTEKNNPSPFIIKVTGTPTPTTTSTPSTTATKTITETNNNTPTETITNANSSQINQNLPDSSNSGFINISSTLPFNVLFNNPSNSLNPGVNTNNTVTNPSAPTPTGIISSLPSRYISYVPNNPNQPTLIITPPPSLNTNSDAPSICTLGQMRSIISEKLLNKTIIENVNTSNITPNIISNIAPNITPTSVNLLPQPTVSISQPLPTQSTAPSINQIKSTPPYKFVVMCNNKGPNTIKTIKQTTFEKIKPKINQNVNKSTVSETKVPHERFKLINRRIVVTIPQKPCHVDNVDDDDTSSCSDDVLILSDADDVVEIDD